MLRFVDRCNPGKGLSRDQHCCIELGKQNKLSFTKTGQVVELGQRELQNDTWVSHVVSSSLVPSLPDLFNVAQEKRGSLGL